MGMPLPVVAIRIATVGILPLPIQSNHIKVAQVADMIPPERNQISVHQSPPGIAERVVRKNDPLGMELEYAIAVVSLPGPFFQAEQRRQLVSLQFGFMDGNLDVDPGGGGDSLKFLAIIIR